MHSRLRIFLAVSKKGNHAIAPNVREKAGGARVRAGRLALSGVALGMSVAAAVAGPIEQKTKAAAPEWSWQGFYAGVHFGGGGGRTAISHPVGPTLFGDRMNTPAAFGGFQLGYNWTLPNSDWVFGLEADISAVDQDSTTTCLAVSGFHVSLNCRLRDHAKGSLTARLGLPVSADKRSLLYVRGGAAWLANRFEIAGNARPLEPQARMTSTNWGWTAGVGIERALTPAWSLRLAYDYTRIRGGSLQSPPVMWQTMPPFDNYVPLPGVMTSSDHSLSLVSLGLNYRFGADPVARFDDVAMKPGQAAAASGWRAEFGARYWYSSGRYQKDLGSTSSPALQNVLVSRLIYESSGPSGELFGRIDAPSGMFAKGFVGAGGLKSGRMYDEDWLISNATVPYSNTLSDGVSGSITYATLDLGYDVLRTEDHRLGGFIGYNFYRENKGAYGCVQFANPFAGCVPPYGFPSSMLIMTEDDDWHSLRIGVAGEIALAPGLRLSTEAAYLPYVRMTGVDNHIQRTDVTNTISPEFAKGQGVQLEALLSYALTPKFSLGVGGRYWAMWATNDAYTNAFGTPCPDCQTLPSRTERYGMFVQASYKFGN